jgi:imidazolonepropionase-like amidohydrolase
VTIVSPQWTSPLRNVEVDIHDGRISSISTGTPSHPSSLGLKTVVIDGRGLYLSPGLIDSHVHLGAIPGMTDEQEVRHPDIAQTAREQIPRGYLLYGFTTLIDLISTPEEMARWKKHAIVPDTSFCGAAALMDGYPMGGPKPQRYQGWPYMLIEPGAEAPPGIDPALHTPTAVVARMKADGAICVKAFYERGEAENVPVPKLETIRELVRAAHIAGLPVILHASSAEAQSVGLEAGVDILAHGLWNWQGGLPLNAGTTEVTPAIKQILDGGIAANVAWQPTIRTLYGTRDLFKTSFLADPLLARVVSSGLLDWYATPEGQWFHDLLVQILRDDHVMEFPKGEDPKVTEVRMNQQSAVPIERDEHVTAYLTAHGGRILFGTDTPGAPSYAQPPGLNGWFEMQRLVEAGVTPAQVFRAATWSNAQAFNLDRDIGTVEVGKRANLLLLREDPTQTIQAYPGIVKVILGGRVLDPADLVANRAK